MQNQLKYIAIILLGSLVACTSNDDPSPQAEIPSTYEFTRNGSSTVDFSGQTTRLNMLNEMKAYLRKGDAGEQIAAQKLLDMFANQNQAFSTAELNDSGKDLESKTLLSDVAFYKELFDAASTASTDYVANGTEAASGISGRIQRGTSTNYILVNEKGWEFTQIIEKGLMGSVLLHQIMNVYLTDDRVGAIAENIELVEGKNYTPKEHYWDEAFGYWGVPVDFDSEGTNLFWGNYTLGREGYTGSATVLKDAFLAGRTAIVNQDQTALDAQRAIIYAEFERVAAATAIHYLNEAIADLNNGDQGNAFHHLSEGYGFVMALRISPERRMTAEQIDQILSSHFGADGNFWAVSIESLGQAKSLLVSVFTEFESIKDEL